MRQQLGSGLACVLVKRPLLSVCSMRNGCYPTIQLLLSNCLCLSRLVAIQISQLTTVAAIYSGGYRAESVVSPVCSKPLMSHVCPVNHHCLSCTTTGWHFVNDSSLQGALKACRSLHQHLQEPTRPLACRQHLNNIACYCAGQIMMI